MHQPIEEASHGCGGACRGCEGGVPSSASPGNEIEPSGWALVGWSAWIFLFPLLTAVAGAWLAGENRTRQALGALAGLAVGAGLAAIVVRGCRRKETRKGDFPL